MAGIAISCIAVAWAAQQATTVDRNYESRGGKIELIGVCKASETEVSCWNQDGTPNEDLTRTFRKSFLSSDYKSLPLRFGSKTRVAVFRVTNAVPGVDDEEISCYFENNRGSFDLIGSTYSEEVSAHVQIRTAVLVTAPDEAVGKVTARIHHGAKSSNKLEVKEGSKLTYLGVNYRLVKTAKTTLDPQTRMQSKSWWMIALTTDSGPKQPASVYWGAVGKDGLAIRAVDKNGNPVLVDPNIANQPGFLRNPLYANNPQQTPPATSLSQAVLTTYPDRNSFAGDDYVIFTNINPAKIGGIFAFGSWQEVLTITGIPLEPRR